MPTDPVFTSPPAPAPAAPAAAEPAAPAVTQADVQAAVAAGLKPIEGFMSQVADHLQNQPAPAAREPASTPAAEGEFWNKFTANPQGAIGEEFGRAAAPLIGQLADTQVRSTLEKFQSSTDQVWGSGAYDALIRDDLDKIVNRALQQNPAAVLNREALETTKDALIGRKAQALVEHKQKAQADSTSASATEIEAAVQAALQKHGIDSTTLSGGIRRVSPTSEKLPDDLHEYLAGKLRDTGVKVDEKRAARMMNTGASYEDWLAADRELSK